MVTGNTPSTADTEIRITGTIDRGAHTGDAVVYHRHYQLGSTTYSATGQATLTGTQTAFPSSGEIVEVIDASEGSWVFEASSDDGFRESVTRRATINLASDQSAVATVAAEEMHMIQERGVGLIACAAHSDVLVTLHGADGEELERYVVDVVSRPTLTPKDGTTLRVCVDAADDRANYLSGGETVGGPVRLYDVNGQGALLRTIDSNSIRLEDTSDDTNYRFFFNGTRTTVNGNHRVQLTVSSAGASATAGLDDGQIYPVKVLADGNLGEPNEIVPGEVATDAEVVVGVWVDSSTLSPGDDGLCSS